MAYNEDGIKYWIIKPTQKEQREMSHVIEGDFILIKSTGQRGQVIWVTMDGRYKVESTEELGVRVHTCSRDEIVPLY